MLIQVQYVVLTCSWRSRSLSLSLSLSRSLSFSLRSRALCSTSLRALSMASLRFFQSLEPSSGMKRTSLRAHEFPVPRSSTLWNLGKRREREHGRQYEHYCTLYHHHHYHHQNHQTSPSSTITTIIIIIIRYIQKLLLREL